MHEAISPFSFRAGLALFGGVVCECSVCRLIVKLQMLQKLSRQLTSIGDHAGPCQCKGYGINSCPVEEHVVLRLLSRGQIVAVIVDEAEAVEPGEGRGPDKAVPRGARLPATQLQSERTSHS